MTTFHEGGVRYTLTRVEQSFAEWRKDPKYVERLANYGVDPLGSSPDEFATMIAADIKLWAEAVRIAGVKLQ